MFEQSDKKHTSGPAAKRRATVLYDGACAFCRAKCEQLRRWDRREQLSFLAIDDTQVAIRYPRLSITALRQEMHVVDGAGHVFRGAAAVRMLCRTLPRLWWLVPLLYIPGSLPVWQWLYRQVALRRYRLATSATSPVLDGSCNGSCATKWRPPPSDTSDKNHEPTDTRLESALRRTEHTLG